MDPSYCPHCGGRAQSHWEGPHRIAPDNCEECGAGEFYGVDDCGLSSATDEEVWTGWWRGEGGETQVELNEAQRTVVQFRREAARANIKRAQEQQLAQKRLNQARQRYIDEALF